MAILAENGEKVRPRMNVSKNISSDIFKNTHWIWLHLASTILLNALIYSSFRVLEFSTGVSSLIAIVGVAVSLILPSIKFPKPSQIKERLYWTVKVVFQIFAFSMLLISIQNLFLFIVWIGVLVSIWGVFLFVVVAKYFNETRSRLEQDFRNRRNEADLSNLNYSSILQNEMDRRQLPPYKVALLTGIDESRILRFTTGDEKPTAEEGMALLDFFDLTDQQLKKYRHTFTTFEERG